MLAQKMLATSVGNILRKVSRHFVDSRPVTDVLQRSSTTTHIARTRQTTVACFDWQVANKNFYRRHYDVVDICRQVWTASNGSHS